jgi:glucokinase
MEYYAGVDVGGTNLGAVVGTDDASSLEASVVGRAARATPRGPDGDAVSAAVLDVLREACAAAGIAPAAVRAAGIGSIGPLDAERGVVVDPVNLPAAIERIDLKGPVQQLLRTTDVTVRNDATAGVAGERATHTDVENLSYVTISTGIGVGACVDGRVLSGADGNAAEFGHTTVDPTGAMQCPCGGPGHWEAYASGRNIPVYARQLHETGVADLDPGVETSLPLDSQAFSARDVFAHAPSDEFASAVLDRVGEWNAIGAANLAHAYAPEKLVVGGAVAVNNPDVVLDSMREGVESCTCVPVPDVSLTQFGDDVVLFGALATAMESAPAR